MRGISWLPKERLAARKKGHCSMNSVILQYIAFQLDSLGQSFHLRLGLFSGLSLSDFPSNVLRIICLSHVFLYNSGHRPPPALLRSSWTKTHSWEPSGPAAVGQSDSSGTGENHTNSCGICPMWYTVLFPPTLQSRTTAAAGKAGQVVRDSWLNSLLTPPNFAWDRQAFASAFVMLICVTLAV